MSTSTPASTLPATTWPDAVLFDCDGTLADTEPLSDRAWAEVLVRYGYEPTDEDFAAVIGHVWPRVFEHFSARASLGDPVTFRAELATVSARLYETELELFEDTVGTIRALVAAGVPVAVVSSSPRAHVERCLAQGGLLDAVAVVVGADDVDEHKPSPAPYLAAATALGVDPRRCVVVEDTAVGLAAGKAAGCFAVAVDRGRVASSALAAADRIVPELSPDAVRGR
ncbi:HAD family phosphatase [Nitriliruptoraceae bacterium ZYF776]|nr:HAD family phosphatase [Profundirhabdus halotolerans]